MQFCHHFNDTWQTAVPGPFVNLRNKVVASTKKFLFFFLFCNVFLLFASILVSALEVNNGESHLLPLPCACAWIVLVNLYFLASICLGGVSEVMEVMLAASNSTSCYSCSAAMKQRNNTLASVWTVQLCCKVGDTTINLFLFKQHTGLKASGSKC